MRTDRLALGLEGSYQRRRYSLVKYHVIHLGEDNRSLLDSIHIAVLSYMLSINNINPYVQDLLGKVRHVSSVDN